jgi:cell division protein ZapA (FtsZ GTPase activity inhibitor)
MSVQIVTIELLGASFTVQTDETVEYMESLVARLRERLDSLRASTRVHDPLKLAILANITLLDELARAKEGFGPQGIDAASSRPGSASDEEEVSRVAARLISVLDQSLESPLP